MDLNGYKLMYIDVNDVTEAKGHHELWSSDNSASLFARTLCGSELGI